MKKIFSLAILICLFTACTTSVPLTQTKDNLMIVKATLNDYITVPFIIDTGASTVSIPESIFETLVEGETIEKGDMLASEKYILADGNIVVCQRVMLKSFKIGNTTLYDVEAIISTNPNAPFLLGQNVISKFKRITIDYRTNKLTY